MDLRRLAHVLWPPALASVLSILGSAAVMGGFGRLFFAESQTTWSAAQGGGLFGLGGVLMGWAAYLLGRWRG